MVPYKPIENDNGDLCIKQSLKQPNIKSTKALILKLLFNFTLKKI